MTGSLHDAGRAMRRAGAWFARLVAFAALGVGMTGAAWAQDSDGPRKALRVCQDPNNLPFSSTQGDGIENKLADVFGKALGLPVTYYSFPQRLAFIRNTLRYKLPGQDFPCDIVMGVPAGFGQVAETKPYYRSTYALVFPRGRGLDEVKSSADFLKLDRAVINKLRIGVYDRSPASDWLARHGIESAGVPYRILNPDPEQYPGEIIERDLAAGKIDAAIVWGPIAGFYAKRVKSPPLNVVPLRSEPGVKFDFQIAMGVRPGEGEWLKQVQSVLDSRQAEIRAVLEEFGVPIVDESFSAGRP